MPGGSPWCAVTPTLQVVPQIPLWHVYKRGYHSLAPNPFSKARMALVGTHKMFYAADSAAGALWETVLRGVAVGANLQAHVLPMHLHGFDIVQIQAQRPDLPLLALGQPGLRALYHDPDSAAAQAVATLLHQPDHSVTHPEAVKLHSELQAVGIVDMPVLSWPSRMHHPSTAYLAYDEPMDSSWWQVVGPVISLDDPAIGYPLVAAALASSGFTWATPLATTATPPPPVPGKGP
ncbi:RES domain-containing protein (plasmid) [Xanthomonas sp. NCPPB 3583]|uniref:RES domain-containing protein n=1 Tax=Xanthomonas sp. NCPPB 3583 TaxID=487558 RepID=UPI00355811CF